MPSIIPGYEYDVFISYRQNDNRSGWVTEFVKNLKEELASTIKNPVSVYLDSNPFDGLLETHQVDTSLEGKVRCLIFIPILSQTYCDTGSFAWQHEFVAFNRFSQSDQFGKTVKLPNGNISSRVLPVLIHDLDPEDRLLVDQELGGPIRGIDFIFKSPGVNRPLRATEDHPQDNQNKTFYRDQLNKVANAVKDIVNGIRNHNRVPRQVSATSAPVINTKRKKQLTISAAVVVLLAIPGFFFVPDWISSGFENTTIDKSIAVLPFENMNKDSTQDYFSNGIAEDILNHLAKIADLRVKSRTSTLQYMGTTKTVSEIGEELNVSNVVEGSVRRVGDRVRIVVQLIDTETDTHLWSETYDRDLDDVLAVQSEIALAIANALETRLTRTETSSIQHEVSQNVTAYDFFLRAREAFKRSNYDRHSFDIAFQLVNEALRLDSRFAEAHALKARLWFGMKTFGIDQAIWRDSTLHYTAKAISLDPGSPSGYLIQGEIYEALGKMEEAKDAFHRAYIVAPNDAMALSEYGFQLIRERDERGADMQLRSWESQYSTKDPEYYQRMAFVHLYQEDYQMAEALLLKAIQMNPAAIQPMINLAELYERNREFDKGLQLLRKAGKINKDYQFRIDLMAELSYYKGDYDTAAKYWGMYPEIEAKFQDSLEIVPFRHRLAMTYLKMGRKAEADKLFQEDRRLRTNLLAKQQANGSWGAGIGGTFYDLALDEAYFGNHAKAVQYLDSAQYYGFYYWHGMYHDDLLLVLRERADFNSVFDKAKDYWAFRKKAFSGAMARRSASKELKAILAQ